MTRVTWVTRVNDQELEGEKLSISLFLGVGNRPPRKKKIGNPRVPGGAWLQVKLKHALREVFQEKVPFSVGGWLDNFFISKSRWFHLSLEQNLSSKLNFRL